MVDHADQIKILESQIRALNDRFNIEIIRADRWKQIAQRYHVCSCLVDPTYDPHGCTDCMNTGFVLGFDLLSEHEKLRERLSRYEDPDIPNFWE